MLLWTVVVVSRCWLTWKEMPSEMEVLGEKTAATLGFSKVLFFV